MAGAAQFIAAQTGWTIASSNADIAGSSALVLFDQSGSSDVSNGDHVLAYTNPLWAILKTFEFELRLAKAQIPNMLAQMETTTAQGEWLDFLANYYDQTRQSGEGDPVFAPRVIAEVLRPRGNNISIAKAVTAQIGQPVQVIDVVNYVGADQIYDGSFAFDGSHSYAGTSSSIQYCLFDIVVGFDLLGSSTGIPVTQITGIVERMRDGGTQLRNFVNQGGTIADISARGAATDSLTIQVTRPVRYDGTIRFDGSHSYSGTQTAPW